MEVQTTLDTITISAAVVALVQLVKWTGIADSLGPVFVVLFSVLGVSLWGYSEGIAFEGRNVWQYFTGGINVALAAAGIFGFTRATPGAVAQLRASGTGDGSGSVIRSFVLILLASSIAMSVACAARGGTPQAQTAHYGAFVIDGVRAFQQWTTSSVDAGALPVAAGRKITDVNQRIQDYADSLAVSLRAYDVATNMDLRAMEAAKIDSLIDSINRELSSIGDVQIPTGIAGKASELIANISKHIAAIEAAVRPVVPAQ